MTRYLLDTNHLGRAVPPGSSLRQRLSQARLAGHRFGTCIPALCELEVGAQQVRRRSQYRRALERLMREVALWPLDIRTTRIYGGLHIDLRRRGRQLSQVDIMLAALARQMNLTLLTSDRDFEALSDVRCENWLM